MSNLLSPSHDANKHIVIIAGEASGDIHAAKLVQTLKQTHSNFTFSGIGGAHMKAAGVNILIDLAQYGVTGIFEVIRHLKVIKKAFGLIQSHLKETQPDLLILVDYPGFNLRLARFAKSQLGIPILYYISPQLWAWKAGRIKTIQAHIDRMAVIFPFEKSIYEQAKVDVHFVGHPLTQLESNTPIQYPSKSDLNLPTDARLLAMLPGSRMNEIERHLPVLFASALKLKKIYPDLHCVIPLASTISRRQVQKYWNFDLVSCTLVQHQKATHVARLADAIVVASGTASLECALLGKPMCIIYKVGMLSAIAASIFLKVQYIGLCNLLHHKMIVPELLQYDCNSKELTRVLEQLLDPTPPSDGLACAIMASLHRLSNMLCDKEADLSLNDLVLDTLANEKKIALKS